MSAVIETGTSGVAAARLPLIEFADPARTFAWRNGRAISVAAFLADVARAARALPAAPCVVNLCENRYAFLVAFCAAACRGQTTLLPPSRAPQAVDDVLAAYPASYSLGEIAPMPARPGFVHLPELRGEADETCAMPMIDAEQIVAIGFTSGSSGQPKAHAKSWVSLRASTRNNIEQLRATLGLAAGALAHVVATVPPQHMYGMEMSVLLPLVGPFAIHAGRPFFPADLATALAQVPAPRLLVTTPVHLDTVLREATLELPPLAAIVSATAPLPAPLAAAAEERYGAPVQELFGSTETCVIAHRRSAHDAAWQVYAGIALQPQPDGTLVSADHLAQPVALQDIVELLPANRFRLCGRNSDLIEIAGKRASLADLGRRLLAQPGVLDAVVFQLDERDAGGVQRIAALVVAPGLDEETLLAELRRAIDPVFLPRPLRKLDRLPRNETGKLPRAALLAALYA